MGDNGDGVAIRGIRNAAVIRFARRDVPERAPAPGAADVVTARGQRAKRRPTRARMCCVALTTAWTVSARSATPLHADAAAGPHRRDRSAAGRRLPALAGPRAGKRLRG